MLLVSPVVPVTQLNDGRIKAVIIVMLSRQLALESPVIKSIKSTASRQCYLMDRLIG